MIANIGPCLRNRVTFQILLSVPPEPKDDHRATGHRNREPKLGAGRELPEMELVSQ